MNFAWQYRDLLFEGAWVTVQLALLSFAIGLVIGFVIAIFRVSPIRPLRAFATLYVSAMVNTPIAFLIFFGFYGITKLGVLVSGFSTAVIVMSAYVGGYAAEAIRSGISTIPNGQAEAARAIGLTFGQVVRHVVLPQAIRSSFGPLGVLLNANFRNVAVAGAIGVGEIVKTQKVLGEGINTSSGQPLEFARAFPFAIASFGFYLVIGLTLAYIALALDRRMAVKR
jgi:glutamate transport system permease protein